MSAKNLDPKGRLRSETIAYRCSPAERKELDKRWKLLGYATKQDYVLDSVLHNKVKMNPKLHIMGILITMVDYRTIYAKEITEVLYEHYGSSIHIFDDVIPLSVRAAEASAEGVSIYKYDGKGKVAAAYEKIVEEVLANEQ